MYFNVDLVHTLLASLWNWQSKYIAKLKKVADRRKLEQEIIYERKVQRDMEREGKQSEDQDTYLTSAYRKKLEERRKLEEELKIEAHMEG